MTAQASEKIIIDDEEYKLLAEPLESYLEKRKLKFDVRNTACWRGYIGTWELKDNELYLTGFYGKIKGKEVDLNFLFPDASSVKADWFTGLLRIPVGDMIQYVHGGFDSVYSDEMYIEMKHGKAVKTTLRHNEYDETLEDEPF